ncbi:MAG: hypothetical protein U0Z75_03485 [Deinococcaceae bacterium]
MSKKSTHFVTRWHPVSVLGRSIAELFRAASFEASLLTVVLVVQGLIPAFALYLTKRTVEGIAQVAQGGSVNLIFLAVLWVSAALIDALLAPVNQVLQGNLGEKFTAHVNLKLISKMEDLPGLDVLEGADYHDDVRILQEGAKNRPLNIMVLSAFTVRELISIAGLCAVMATVGWWIPLVVLIGAIPQSKMSLKLREVGWNALISRTPQARVMEYNARIALNQQNAAEVRLYGLLPWLKERYNSEFTKMHTTMRSVRSRQAFGVLPSGLLSLCVSGGLFFWMILQATHAHLAVGAIVVVVQGLSQVQGLVFSLIEGFGQIFERILYFDKCFKFLGIVPEVRNAVHTRDIQMSIFPTQVQQKKPFKVSHLRYRPDPLWPSSVKTVLVNRPSSN